MNNQNHAWKVKGSKHLSKETCKKSGTVNGKTVILNTLTSDPVSYLVDNAFLRIENK